MRRSLLIPDGAQRRSLPTTNPHLQLCILVKAHSGDGTFSEIPGTPFVVSISSPVQKSSEHHRWCFILCAVITCMTMTPPATSPETKSQRTEQEPGDTKLAAPQGRAVITARPHGQPPPAGQDAARRTN